MEANKFEKKVADIVCRISGQPAININMNGDLKDELSLDSVQIVELFAALEQEFKVELPLKLMTVRTCKEFLRLLEESVNNPANVN